jgi:hypothetical protein
MQSSPDIDSLILQAFPPCVRQLQFAPVQAVRFSEIWSKTYVSGLASELMTSSLWEEEYWVLDEQGDVQLVSPQVFLETAGQSRFSRSDSLREANRRLLPALTNLERVLHSSELGHALSSAYGEPVHFLSLEAARYRNRHFLRRHSDLVGGRRFAIVMFFSEGWQPGYGGELIFEAPSGAITAIQPVGGTGAVIPIHLGCWHAVKLVQTSSWARISLSVHFGASN